MDSAYLRASIKADMHQRIQAASYGKLIGSYCRVNNIDPFVQEQVIRRRTRPCSPPKPKPKPVDQDKVDQQKADNKMEHDIRLQKRRNELEAARLEAERLKQEKAKLSNKVHMVTDKDIVMKDGTVKPKPEPSKDAAVVDPPDPPAAAPASEST